MSAELPPLWQSLSSPTSIRLLTLHPATESDATIRTTLEEVDLDLLPSSYEAISYTGGTDNAQDSIIVNGSIVEVRQCLFQALSRFRQESPRVLWVDALCISQTDVKEKGQQVQNMGKVFGRADKVLVWLGEHADESEALFRHWPWATFEAVRKVKSAIPNPWSSGRVLSMTDLERRQRIWSCFLSRPYFTRTWIVQELVVAKSLLIHCGGSLTSWDKLIRFDFSSKRNPRFDGIPIRVTGDSVSSFFTPLFTSGNVHFSRLVARLNVIERFRKTYHQPHDYYKDKILKEDKFSSAWILVKGFDSSMTIAELAHTFRKTHCSDVRDKIYALISLDEERLTPIIADYSLSAYQVLLSLVRQRAANEWQLAEFRTRDWEDGIMQRQECHESVKRMAANLADTLELAGDKIHFTNGGHLRYLCALTTLDDFLQVLEILIEDERKLSEAQQLVKERRFEEAIAPYQLDQDGAEDPHLARSTNPDVYDVFLAIVRQRIARFASDQAPDLWVTDPLDHAIQVASALGVPNEHVDEHGRWCLPARDEFCQDKHGARYFDYDFHQLETPESMMCALEDFVSRKRAGVGALEWVHTPEAQKMREELGLAQDGMLISDI